MIAFYISSSTDIYLYNITTSVKIPNLQEVWKPHTHPLIISN